MKNLVFSVLAVLSMNSQAFAFADSNDISFFEKTRICQGLISTQGEFLEGSDDSEKLEICRTRGTFSRTGSVYTFSISVPDENRRALFSCNVELSNSASHSGGMKILTCGLL